MTAVFGSIGTPRRLGARAACPYTYRPVTRIAIGADHAGYELKQYLVPRLRGLGHEVTDLGTNSAESVDYPPYCAAVGRAVRDGEADLGIVLGPMVVAGVGGKVPETLVYQRLQTEPLVLALPQAHPQAKLATPVALARFGNEAFISFPRQAAPGLHDAVTGACSEAGFSQRVVQEAIQMQTIISLVSAGMGVALVPESLMSLRRPGVVYRKLRGGKRAALEIGLLWRRDNAAAVLKRFVALAGA